ncbi:F0F1 ATP synthase subunit delta [bacterium]|nr:F0F1 ATP synthase subunit delta [bacterium]
MAELNSLARPYAKAAFEFANAADDLANWSTQLKTAFAVSQNEKMVAMLSSPALTTTQQAEQFIAVCGDELTGGIQNFIKILADNKRLLLLPSIAILFEEFKANREKRVNVEVATAYELDADIQAKLATALTGKLDRDVTVNTVIDKALIGGIVVRAADVVIDGSLRGRLDKLAEALNS